MLRQIFNATGTLAVSSSIPQIYIEYVSILQLLAVFCWLQLIQFLVRVPVSSDVSIGIPFNSTTCYARGSLEGNRAVACWRTFQLAIAGDVVPPNM